MKMTGLEKAFVNSSSHSRQVAAHAVRLLRHVPVQRGWSYLDVGCGNGLATLCVADALGLDVVGVDVDPRQIQLSKRIAGNRRDAVFVIGDAVCLPFESNRFDIVASNKATHHIPKWAAALGEIERVLRPGGYLIFADLTVPGWAASALRSVARGKAGVFTTADLDTVFARLSIQSVHRTAAFLTYEAVFRKVTQESHRMPKCHVQ